MKAIGKIGVLLISLFVLTTIFFFITLQITGSYRINPLGVVTIIGFSWFISYSKWANDNIWNAKTSKPTNTSYSSSEKVVEPINEPVDDNHDILGNINLPSLSTKEENEKETLLKIEELKKQIESLESSLKTNDSNKLPEEKIDYGEYWKKREKFNPDDFKHKLDDDNETLVYILIVLVILSILGVVGYSM